MPRAEPCRRAARDPQQVGAPEPVQLRRHLPCARHHGAPASCRRAARSCWTRSRLIASTFNVLESNLRPARMCAKACVIGGLGDVELTPVARRSPAAPRRPVRRGSRSQSLQPTLHSVAHETGTTSQGYADPVEFFRRTFLTDGLKDLLTQAANRITGGAGSPSHQSADHVRWRPGCIPCWLSGICSPGVPARIACRRRLTGDPPLRRVSVTTRVRSPLCRHCWQRDRCRTGA